MEFEPTLNLLSALLGPLDSQPAYLDPGSGSILIQLLIAGALGAGFLLRNSWGKIKSLFGIKESDEEETMEETAPEDEG